MIRKTTITANISINLNKLPIVTAEELAWEPDDVQREDNYIKDHNKRVLDLNFPRELCFQEGDIPIDINFVDVATGTNWYDEKVFLGIEGTDDEDGCGTEESFIGYLPDRILEDKKDGDIITLSCAIDECLITIMLVCKQVDNIENAPFESFEEAFKFMID